MRTLILGDIHGRTIWKDIIKKENPDFMADSYQEILEYIMKEEKQC